MYKLQINELTPGQKYYVKVRAKAPGYATSEWSPAFEFEAEQDQIPPERVRNLTFTSEGDSFIARWEAPELNMDGTPCTDLSYYIITLVNADASRTVHLETSTPELIIDLNSNRQLFGTPSGVIEITVSAVDRVGNVGPGTSKIAQNNPPAKVENVTAEASVETVNLKWDASAETDIEKYNIYVSNEGADFAISAAALRGSAGVGTTTFSYTTTSLSPLYFKVTAVDKFGQESPASDAAMAQPKLSTDFDKTPPGLVENLTVTQTLADDQASAIARLSFSPAPDDDLDKYEVEYRKTGESILPWSFLNIPSDQTSAEIKPLPLSTSYDFRVRAVDFLANKGAWSPVVVAPGVKKTTLPAAPTGVTVRGGTTNLMVTWNPSTDPSMANWAGTYEVQISKTTTFTSPITIKTSSTLASFISLDANTIYYVRIRSIDPYGNTGAWSTRAQENTGQALDPLASRIYWADTEPTGGRTNDVWIKIPENVQYRFDGTDWIKAQDAELAGEIDNVRQTADGKNKAWYQTTKPPATNNTQGDLWFDTDDGNKLHVWSTSANDWVSAQDEAIQDALDNAADALQTADGKNTIFYATPAAGAVLREGDTWFDNAVIKVYKNGAWVDASTALDNAKANQAIQIAGSKNKTYYVAKASATGMIEGDILFDTAEGNKQYRYDGSTWVAVTDAAIAAAEEAAGQAQETADKKNTIYYSTPPVGAVLKDGDTWFDGPTIKTYRNGVWTDSSSNLETQQGANAIQVAGLKNKTYYTTFANRPTEGLTEGDLLFDTGNKYKQYRYTNAGWLSVQDGTIADAKTAADQAKAAAELRAQTFYGSTGPANNPVGTLKVNDLWIDSDNERLHRWNGTIWEEVKDADITAAQNSAAEAMTSANAKNRSVFSTDNATGTSLNGYAFINGDMWYRRGTGDSIIGMWEFSNGAWTSKTINNEVIANLDAGKINAGTINADRIGSRSISATKLKISDTTNLVPDARLDSLDGWRFTRTSVKTEQSYRYIEFNDSSYSNTAISDAFGVQPGEYLMEFELRKTPGSTGGGKIIAYLELQNLQGSRHSILSSTQIQAGADWSKHSESYIIPEGAQGAKVWLETPRYQHGVDVRYIVVKGKTGTTLIEDGAITTEKVHAEAITASELAAGAVTADKIKANEIDSSKIVVGGMDGSVVIADGTITATEIAGQTITGDKIQGNTIDATHIKAGSITIGATSPIAPGTVATPSDVSTAKSEAITEAGTEADTKVSTAVGPINTAVTGINTKLGGWTKTGTTFIDGGAIFADSITVDQIGANAITASELAADAVTAAKIKAGEIDSTKIISTGLNGSTVITDGTITTAKIGAEQITGAKIAANTITVGNMGPDSVDTTVIQDGAITTNKILANNITAGKIATDAIETRHIKADQIDASHIKAGSITIGTGAPIAPGTVATPSDVNTAKNDAVDTAGTNADGKITTALVPVNANISSVTTTANSVKTLTDGWKYQNTTYINGGNIQTDTITALQIASKTITAEEIKGGTITATEIAGATITANEIKGESISGDKLAVNAAIVNNLQIQSALTINSAGGHIKSSNYTSGGTAGFYMDQQQLIINQGKIKAAALEIQDSQNILPTSIATLSFSDKFYQGKIITIANNFEIDRGTGYRGSDAFVATTDNQGLAMVVFYDDLMLEAGEKYIVSAHVKGSSVPNSVFPLLQGPDGEEQTVLDIGEVALSDGWKRVYVAFEATTASAGLLLLVNSPTEVNKAFSWSRLQLERMIGADPHPSPWKVPGLTTISGDSIVTGAISSNETVPTANGSLAKWSINTEGNARFADATIDGKLIVGADVSNKEATSIQSDTYAQGLAGWAIKGNGDVEFNNGTFRGMLSLEKAGVDLTMNASVSTIDTYIDTTNFKPIDTANIRGTTYGYKRATPVGSNVFMPTEPDPFKFAHFFIGPTTEKALNIQVHDGPEQDNIYLSQPPNNITLTSINLGEQTNPNSEPSFRENQGVAIKTYRNEARDYNLGGQQTGTDLNVTSSSYELLTRERSAVIPEIAVGESEYPQAKQEWSSTSVYETPKAKNLFPSNFVRGGAFVWTGFGNVSIASVVDILRVGQFGLGTQGHTINNTSSAGECGFDMTLNVPTAGPHIVSFYVNIPNYSTSPTYIRVAENSASFIANEGISPAINHPTFGVLGSNHTEVLPGTTEKRVSFYIGSLAAGTRIIRLRFYLDQWNSVTIYKPQLERAAFRSDTSLPAEIRQSYLPTPWTENNARSSSNVSFKLQAEPIVDPLEFERSFDPAFTSISPQQTAEAVLSFSAENQSPGPKGYQAEDAEFKFSPKGLTFPGANVPYLPTGAAIDYDFTGMALASRPAVGGSTSGVTLRVNNYPVRVNNGKEVVDNFSNDISGSKEFQMPGWDIRNQAAEDVTLRVLSGSLRSSETNNKTSSSGDGLILARKTTKMGNTNQSVTVTMLRLQFPFAAWDSRGGPVINIDPATGARIVAYFDNDENVIRVIRYSNYTTKAATILTASFTWKSSAEFTLTLSRSGNNITLSANGNVLGTATNQSNLPNGLYTGISPRSGSFRNFRASDGGDLPGAPGELAHAVNVNNGRGLSVSGTNGAINVSAPGFYQVSMYLFPDGKFGTNSADHFQIMVNSGGRNQRMSPDLCMYGDGVLLIQGSTIAYLTGVAEFLIWSNDGTVNRLNRAEIRIVRMA